MKKILIFALIIISVSLFLFTSCSNDSITTDMSVEDIWAKYEKSVPYDERVQTKKLDKVTLNDVYGLSYVELDEFVAHIPLKTDNADEAIIVKVLSGQREYTVTKFLERQEQLAQTWDGKSSEQLEFIENYTIIQRGNYILFTIGPNSNSIVKAFESAF